MQDAELRKQADAGSAEHQWLIALAFWEKKQAGRANRYLKKAFEQGYPEALRYKLREWTSTPHQHANFKAANTLLSQYASLAELDDWRWHLAIVQGSFSEEQNQVLTRQQVERENPLAFHYAALRCALAGLDGQAAWLMEQAAVSGDPLATAILDRNALDDITPLPAVQAEQLTAEDWSKAFSKGLPTPAHELAPDPAVTLTPQWLPVMACRLLAAKAKPELQPSLTYDAGTGQQQQIQIRTSYSMALMPWLMDPAIAYIQHRLADACDRRPSQSEVLGLLRYKPGQAYQLHYDAFDPAQPGAEQLFSDGGQRTRTALVYLNNGYTGGETRLEHLDLEVKGNTGDLLIFDNVRPGGERHPDSLHMGKPIVSGTKWLLSQWYREEGTAFSRQMDWVAT